MKNQRIRNALTKYNMKQWKLASIMGIGESTLVRRLRKELPDEEQDRIIAIIEKEGGDSHK